MDLTFPGLEVLELINYASLHVTGYTTWLDQLSTTGALLDGFPNLKCLMLTDVVAEALVEYWRHVDVVPAFDQLKRLEMCCYPRLLGELLERMPCIKSLKFGSITNMRRLCHLAFYHA